MRQRASSSRERLRAAAKALFAEKGYEATSMADVTRAAQTSHSQFLKYYSGKEELRREIIDSAWAELTKAIVLASISVPSPMEKLKLAGNMLISFLESDPEFRAILLLEQTAPREKGVAIASRQFREFVAVLDDILTAMHSDGQLRKEVSVEVLRSALLGAIEGMMRHQLLNHDFAAKYSLDQVRSMLNVMIDGACDFERPEAQAVTGEAPVSSEADWIRYYLKLADRALHPSELS
ncbi:MAG: TetR/AcrR family transcriptional regulator [Acidobacteria bacterium]|nr:TetR/AcrR family transcriptional regulator [Acidobacteriota bacterium]